MRRIAKSKKSREERRAVVRFIERNRHIAAQMGRRMCEKRAAERGQRKDCSCKFRDDERRVRSRTKTLAEAYHECRHHRCNDPQLRLNACQRGEYTRSQGSHDQSALAYADRQRLCDCPRKRRDRDQVVGVPREQLLIRCRADRCSHSSCDGGLPRRSECARYRRRARAHRHDANDEKDDEHGVR